MHLVSSSLLHKILGYFLGQGETLRNIVTPSFSPWSRWCIVPVLEATLGPGGLNGSKRPHYQNAACSARTHFGRKHHFKMVKANLYHIYTSPLIQMIIYASVQCILLCHISQRKKTSFLLYPMKNDHYEIMIIILVGGLNPSEKYESQLGWWTPQQKWKNKSHVPVTTNQHMFPVLGSQVFPPNRSQFHVRSGVLNLQRFDLCRIIACKPHGFSADIFSAVEK